MSVKGLARLARILTGYSTPVKKGNTVCVEGFGHRSLPLIREIYRQCLKKGALMTEYRISYPELARDFFDMADPEQLGHFPNHQFDFLKKCDVYIGVRAEENLMELASVPREKILARTKLLRPLTDWRINRTRWVITRLPTEAMAQTAGLSKEELDELYFNACLQNWREVSKRQDALVDLLLSGRTLRLSGRRTDLTLDIEGMPVVKADGHRNMPDGEVFTAPRLRSAEGKIEFNCPSYYGGTKFSEVYLEFKKGKVVKARAGSGQEDLAKIIKTDDGSSYLGEFAFGLNHGITRPTGIILFDEKVAGSIHLALGNSYEKCSNGNRSAIHWDLVRMMKEDGEVYLDGKLIQKQGLFIPPALKLLNSP